MGTRLTSSVSSPMDRTWTCALWGSGVSARASSSHSRQCISAIFSSFTYTLLPVASDMAGANTDAKISAFTPGTSYFILCACSIPIQILIIDLRICKHKPHTHTQSHTSHTQKHLLLPYGVCSTDNEGRRVLPQGLLRLTNNKADCICLLGEVVLWAAISATVVWHTSDMHIYTPAVLANEQGTVPAWS